MQIPPPLRRAVKRQSKRWLLTGMLALTACVATGFVGYILAEALDGDLGLWPIGSDEFTVIAQDPPPAAGQLAGSFQLQIAIIQWVIAAGAQLVAGHRARSALAAHRLPFTGVLWPSPGPEQHGAPVLGHCFSGRKMAAEINRVGCTR